MGPRVSDSWVHPPESTCLQPRDQRFLDVRRFPLFFVWVVSLSPSALSGPLVPVISQKTRVQADHVHFAGTANAVAGAVKYSESAGGFYYVESGKLFSVTRNRFIHW